MVVTIEATATSSYSRSGNNDKRSICLPAAHLIRTSGNVSLCLTSETRRCEKKTRESTTQHFNKARGWPDRPFPRPGPA